jgi:hypothetical protein
MRIPPMTADLRAQMRKIEAQSAQIAMIVWAILAVPGIAGITATAADPRSEFVNWFAVGAWTFIFGALAAGSWMRLRIAKQTQREHGDDR